MRDMLYRKEICKAFCIKIKPFFMCPGITNKLSCPLFREREIKKKKKRSKETRQREKDKLEQLGTSIYLQNSFADRN